MPGQGKTYEQFRDDDARCRGIASQANGNVSAQQAADQSAVGSAALGTALGAVAGGLIGSTTGHLGAGAAIGAGTGLLVGSAAGANAAQQTGANFQRNYDITYAQCMSAAGDSVPPVAAPMVYQPAYPVGYGPGWYYGPPIGVEVGWGWHRRHW